MSKKYFGIDLGTENIGYAVTDENYNVVKVNGHNAMGASTYSSENIKANTAVDRRTFRVARRRLMRRKYRITLLQELFSESMAAVDKNFFVKLNENDLNIEHKSVRTKYSLFNDGNYRDNEYYKQYPTIYHLRKDIIDNGTDDIRKLYLAVHHIIKYRGHFLIEENLDAQSTDSFSSDSVLHELSETLIRRSEEIDGQNGVNTIAPLLGNVDEKLSAIYNNDKMRRSDKKRECYEILRASSKPQKAMVDAIFGFMINVTSLFGAGAYEKSSIANFSFDSGYDDVSGALMSKLEESDYQIICLLKQLHDNRVLVGLLKGSNSISMAMVAKYDKHQSDLAELKALIREFAPASYNDMFGLPLKVKKKEKDEEKDEDKDEEKDKGKYTIDEKKKNYTQYIGGGRPNGKDKYCNGRLNVTCSQEEFGAYVKACLSKITAEDAQDRIKKILSDIEEHCYMPRILSKNNSLLPYQLNLLELDAILLKIGGNSRFAFLKSSENGITVGDKIKLLLSFRVPYYVGPLKYYHESETKSKFAWAVRCNAMIGRITPWNFDSIIDQAASNEQFIVRMSSACSYLKGKTALPKNSIIYSKYMALSELNKLKINDVTMDTHVKNEIWQAIYMAGNGKPSIAKIVSLLKAHGHSDVKISGYDDNLKGDMSNYHCFKRIIGDKVDSMPQMVERLIFLMTVHNEAKILADSLEKEFGEILSASEIKSLKGLRFNGWGRLSYEFLAGGKDGITLLDKSDGEYKSIVNIMQETSLNIMEIMHSERFDYKEKISQYNADNNITVNSNITYSDVDAMYCSPSVKRSVWQTFKLIKSLVKETGGEPDKIFIEVTREPKDDKKGKTKSRKEQIMAIYDSADKTKNSIYIDDINAARSGLGRIDNKILSSEKIFLYFMQMGRCAYSNTHIDIGDDFSGLSLYDVDHIIPQSKKKDDSIDNKVLVRSILNKGKGDTYPVLEEYQKNASALWKYLHSVNLMSEEKYTRLMRVTPLSPEEEENFIKRQLVETGQMALLVRDLLDRWLNSGEIKTEIIMNKAANVSDFRKTYSLTKSRDANNFHHAVDAYLNVVVGNVLNEKFNHSSDYEHREGSTNFKKVFNSNVYSHREKQNIWENNIDYCTINKVREQLDTNDYSVSKKIVTGKGELYKSTIYKADKYAGQADIYARQYADKDIDDKDDKIKNSKTKKYTMKESKLDASGKELNAKSDCYNYGHKKSSGTAYFVVVDTIVKKKDVRRIEAISIYHDNMIKAGKMTLLEALAEKSLGNPTLVNLVGMKNPIIKIGALLYVNGAYLRIAGVQDDKFTMHNANELWLPSGLSGYLKEISVISDKIIKAISLCKKDEKAARIEEEFCSLEEDKRRRKLVGNQNSSIVLVTLEDNLSLYDYLCKKTETKPYSGIPGYSSFINLIHKGRDSFVAMTKCKQIFVLLKLIKAFQCNASKVDGSDLSYLKNGKRIFGKATMCSIRLSKKISQTMVLIHQNSSGLKQYRVQVYKSPTTK